MMNTTLTVSKDDMLQLINGGDRDAVATKAASFVSLISEKFGEKPSLEEVILHNWSTQQIELRFQWKSERTPIFIDVTITLHNIEFSIQDTKTGLQVTINMTTLDLTLVNGMMKKFLG